MPKPAPATPLSADKPAEVPAEAVEVVPAPTWTHRWEDPLGRPMTGTVSLTRMGRPALTVTADLVDSAVSLPLVAGRYRMVAALFDPDGTRSYDLETITVGG